MTHIAILGAGLMGSATVWPLSDNDHSVRLVGTHLDTEIIQSCKARRYHPRLERFLPERVQPFFVEELPQALEDVEVIVSGVNSMGVHWVGRTLGPWLRAGQKIIAVTKGLEANDAGQVMILPEVLRAELPEGIRDKVSLAAIGGPCIAGELAGRRPSCVVFGSRDRETVESLAALFRTGYYHIWTTTDLLSLEICAALKNAYTLGVGLAYGMLEKAGGPDQAGASMHNLAAALFAQGCTEMDRILQILGGDRTFAYRLPGAGDLYVTSMGGRTVRLGKLLGAGKSYPAARQMMAGETLEAAEIVKQMSKILPVWVRQERISADEFPLLRMLIEVVVHEKAVELPLDTFFNSPDEYNLDTDSHGKSG